ncbi:MAG: hypothetical protein IKQ70_15710 [Bacteroidales bacterium]|nr:hypothetical protein [Bacteroidales bacterium]
MKAIVVKNNEDTGKTTTLIDLLSIFRLNGCTGLSQGDLGLDKSQHDFWAHFTYKGKKIGIVSAGDPKDSRKETIPPQKDKLEDFYLRGKPPFDIIVCASRTKGEPLSIITTLFPSDSIVWFSNFTSKQNHSILNNCSAKAIFDLVDRFIANGIV